MGRGKGQGYVKGGSQCPLFSRWGFYFHQIVAHFFSIRKYCVNSTHMNVAIQRSSQRYLPLSFFGSSHSDCCKIPIFMYEK